MKRPGVLVRLLRRRESGVFLALVLMVILISVFQPKFRTPYNLYLVSRQIAYPAIMALGVFFVILTSGIDLSISSVVCFSGIACGMAMAAGLPPLLAVGAGLLAGGAVGAVNGSIVSYVGVTPFIVTLGMMSIARGLVVGVTHGESIRNIPTGFLDAANKDVLGMPMPVAILLVLAAISHVVLTYTPFGRRVYAIGGNEDATALSGVNTRRVKFATYVIASVLSSVTGILFIARLNAAQADAGKGMELDAIAAAVIGGTSLMGGQGSVAGVLIGATIMGVIRNAMVLIPEVSSYWQDVVIGGIIVLAAILDIVRSRRK